MNKKYYHPIFQHLFGNNTGTWVLIFLHIAILVAVVQLFAEIIRRMQGF
jgi:hypothetical protein